MESIISSQALSALLLAYNSEYNTYATQLNPFSRNGDLELSPQNRKYVYDHNKQIKS